jgi:hypothetical protein
MKWSVRRLGMGDVPIILDWYNNEDLHYIAAIEKTHTKLILLLAKLK